MPTYRTFQTTFTSGEFEDKLRDRTDIRAFFEGAQRMRNVALLSQGGFTRRCGSFLGSQTVRGRLIPFEYSDTDALLVQITPAEAKIYDLNMVQIDTVSFGFGNLNDLKRIKYVQRGNGLILTSERWYPQLLLRDPETNTFTISRIPLAQDGEGNTIWPKARSNVTNEIDFTSGSISDGVSTTITSSQPFFESTHFDTYLYLDGGQFYVTIYDSPTQVQGFQIKAPNRALPNNSIQTTNGSPTLIITMGGHGFAAGQTIVLEDFITVGGINPNGTYTVTTVRDENSFTITAGGNATSDDVGGGALGRIRFTGPSTQMFEQAWSPKKGYPEAVGIHDQRLWFGNTKEQPSTLWASRVSEFDNFDVGEGLPNEAIGVTIDEGQVNAIRHIVSSRDLQILTNQNEFYIPSRETTPVTPETIVIRKQTPFGASHVRASIFDGATLFTQESGRAVREFLYTDREFAYNARNIALLAQHLIEEPEELQTLYGGTTRPEQYAFFLNRFGTLTVLHAIRSEEMIGWVQWETQGIYTSVAVVGQRVFVLHEHPNAITYIEELDFTFQYFMDGIIGFSAPGEGATSWGPALEYANQEVAVTTEDYFLGYTTVDADGYFETEFPYNTVEIGLNFMAQVKTNQVAFQLPNGPFTGLPLRLTRAVIDFGNSRSWFIDGQRLIVRKTTDFPPDVPDPVDGKEEFWINKVTRNPYIEFVSEYPLETTVYSALLEVAF